MNKYVVVVSFVFSPKGLIFYVAHIFVVRPGIPEDVQTVQVSVTASTPEQALAEGEFLAWLLNL